MVNFLEDKISVNSKSILQRFQTVESCIWTLDKIFGGKLFSTRKLISFLLADALCFVRINAIRLRSLPATLPERTKVN
jgi:hypothetical protein